MPIPRRPPPWLLLAPILAAPACGDEPQRRVEAPIEAAAPAGDLASSASPPGAQAAPSVGAGPGNADVEYVRAVLQADGLWTFHVTVRHPDRGWTDYADAWDVVLPDGSVVLPSLERRFTRPLQHPHETEQPFTRSERGLVIPDGVTGVTVRAHDLVDGWGGREIRVDLTQKEGDGFVVVRK